MNQAAPGQGHQMAYWLAKSVPMNIVRGFKKERPARYSRGLPLKRDGASLAEVLSAVWPDFAYGGFVDDLPPGEFTDQKGRALGVPALPRILGRASRGDLVIQTTRPPLDDDRTDHSVERSGSPLEMLVHAALRDVFRQLRPREVWLDEDAVRSLPRDFCRRPTFRGKGEATSKAIGRNRGVPKRLRAGDCPWRDPDHHEMYGWSAGYSAYLPDWDLAAAGGGTTRLLVTFGMDAPANLLWAHLLATQVKAVLRKMIAAGRPALLVGEFPFWLPVKDLPGDLSFTDFYDVFHAVVPLEL